MPFNADEARSISSKSPILFTPFVSGETDANYVPPDIFVLISEDGLSLEDETGGYNLIAE